MVRVGTSGFSYADWVGPFYPKGLSKSRWLEFYASEFSCLEINASFYSWIAEGAMRSIASRVPAGFRFAVKLHRSMTHEDHDLEPLLAATSQQNKLLDSPVLLAQFPNSFKPSEDAWRRIEELCSLDNLVVEFRNALWQTPATSERLVDLGASLCAVDMPRIPGLPKSLLPGAGDIGYFRAHGRNTKKWYGHEEAYERYDYLYSQGEIAAIAECVRKTSNRAGETLVFFNNHYGAQAVVNARQLAKELGVDTTPTQPDLFSD